MTEIKNNIVLIDNSKYVDFNTVFTLPYSITGYDYKSEIRDIQGNLITTFVIVIDTVLKTISLSLTPLQKANLIPRTTYKFDVVETNISLSERVIIRGDYFCMEGVSR